MALGQIPAVEPVLPATRHPPQYRHGDVRNSIHPRCYVARLGPLANFTCADVHGPLTFSIAQGAAIIVVLNRTYVPHLEIPHELGGAPVAALRAGAFMCRTNLTSVDIAATVT